MRSASIGRECNALAVVSACASIFGPVRVQEIEERLAAEPARKLGHLHNEHHHFADEHRAKRTVCVCSPSDHDLRRQQRVNLSNEKQTI